MSRVVDARGLPPPEPFERVMDALLDLEPGESLTLLVDRVPYPLFRILERDGYIFDYQLGAAGTAEVTIAVP